MSDIKQTYEAENPAMAEIKGTVFIIPFDAPVPNLIEDLVVTSPSLLGRLQTLTTEPELFALLPLSGQEMFDIAASFSALAVVKKYSLLEDLPGARYDALLVQGIRRAGIRSTQWPFIADLIESSRRIDQRLKDAKPWLDPRAGSQKVPPATVEDDFEEGPI